MKKQIGFTLVDLLIAIGTTMVLAVILFPVFARLQERDRQKGDISNEKLLGLAISQYVQDNDEAYPMAAQYSASAFGASFNGWVQTTFAYTGSLETYCSPDDPQALQPLPFPGGVGISYACNGIMVNLSSGVNHLRGVMGFDNSWYGGGNCSPTDPAACGTDNNFQRDANIRYPSQTILLANCFSEDADNSLGSGCNSSTFALSSDFMGGGNGNPAPDNTGAGDYAAAEEYPSGLETQTDSNCKPYQGNVSTPYDGGTETDFLFVDGHVASMTPLSTNPQPVTMPHENLWVANRPDNDSKTVNWAQ